jgi:hypothetical protein
LVELQFKAFLSSRSSIQISDLLLPLIQEDASRLERSMGANLLSGEAAKKERETTGTGSGMEAHGVLDCVDYRHGATGMWMSQEALG